MPNDATEWTLKHLIDFEQVLLDATETPQVVREQVIAKIRGTDGMAARRLGLRVWLDEMGETSSGRKFFIALSWVRTALAGLLFCSGASAVIGLQDPSKGGIHVILFLVILIGGQALVLLCAVIAWFFRRETVDGFSGVQGMIARWVRRIAGQKDAGWWERVMNLGGEARAAILWNLAAVVQVAGVFFNLGIVFGLVGLVLVKQVSFFWESTTDFAMSAILERTVQLLAWPWASIWPEAVPNQAVIEASRWHAENTAGLIAGPAAWWQFLLMSTLVWGLLPRILWWILACRASRKALMRLDFQGKNHRALWRDLTGAHRIETGDQPMDGVLVLDVGGSGLSESVLRPFLLQRLRVHPTAWHSTAVMDAGAEHEAALSLAKAPAGVVLLAEGWALSPPRMKELHTRVRSHAGSQTPILFLVANVDAEHLPCEASQDECQQWEIFVDSLRDPMAEIFFYTRTMGPTPQAD